MFSQLAKAIKVPVTIFELASSDEVCMERLHSRGRHDDKTEDIIKTRLFTYRTTTTSAMNNLFNKLQEQGVKSSLISVDASIDGAENVWKQVKETLQ